MKFVLITGRTTQQGKGLEFGKTSKEYLDGTAVAFLNEDNMKELGLTENASVKVSTEYGSIVVKSKKGELDRGMVFIPLGPWASALIGSGTEGTGMPKAKGVEAKVSKTSDMPTPLDDILKLGGA